LKIPLVDLKTQYESIKREVDFAIQAVIDESAFTLGKYVERFERSFAKYCGTKYCIGVSSGTDALHLALRACGIGQGDEVITVPNTFIATAEAISMTGAKPVFVDIDEQTYNMDAERLREYLEHRNLPKAVIPVHLYGQPCNMDTILKIAKQYNLKVIEDACQAHGALYYSSRSRMRDVKNRYRSSLLSHHSKTPSPKPITHYQLPVTGHRSPVGIGTMGDAGCFSFYPGKNLGAYGDGGAIITNNPEIAQKLRLLRNHGQESKYIHLIKGYCNRLHAMQAAILSVKLKRLDEWNQRRRENALIYDQLLEDTGIIPPYVDDKVKHVYHLYVIRIKNRDTLRTALKSKGIATGIHYPIPLHLQPAYAYLGHKPGDFPITERVANEILSLPMFPELTPEQIEYIVKQIKDFGSFKSIHSVESV